jgi:hypothetical protein
MMTTEEAHINNEIQRLDIDTNQISDGYHSFGELYAMRLALTAALFNEWGSAREYVQYEGLVEKPKYDVHKSRKHHDGELCFGGGWFIVCATLPLGQISFHYEEKDWDLFKIPAVEKAKYEWDGHTSNDVIERLKAL